MTLPSNIKNVAEAIDWLVADNASKSLQITVLQGRAAVLESKVPVPIVPPTVVTRAAIGSDGTPQVGEELTGVDPIIANGIVTSRRWLLGATELAATNRYTPVATGEHRFEVIATGPGGTVSSGSTIVVAAASAEAKLLANPAPAEPEAQAITGSRINSEFIEAPVASYDIDIVGMTDQSWAVQMAGNNDPADSYGNMGNRSVFVRNGGSGRIGIFWNDAEGNLRPTYLTNEAAPIQSGTFDLRIRRTRGLDANKEPIDNFKLYFGTDAIVSNAPQFDITMPGARSPGNFVRVGTTYNNDAMFDSGTVKPTSLVTDRLILSKAAINSLGVFSADADYYLPAADAFTIEVRSLQGETIVAPAPYAIIANPQAGKASLKAPFSIPATRKGSRVQVVSRALATAGVLDIIEITYPNETQFGQNVASLFNPNRSRRVFSNMLVQSYWQNAGGADSGIGGYDTYKRNSPGVTDGLGMPLRAGLWGNYPLPDQQNQEVTLQLKYTNGAGFNIVNEGVLNQPIQGVTKITPVVRVDANTFEWTIAVDRTLARGLERFGTFRITSLDPADPPQNMTLCVKGVDDLTQRFCQSFIDKLKLIRGRLRFMDDLGVNGAMYAFGQKQEWSKRAKQTGICGDIAVEDMIELCNRTNRPLFWNVNATYAYEEGGLDYFDRMCDMLYFGTGAEFASRGFTAPNGIIKHIAAEIGNENWNYEFNRKGTYHYLIAAGNRLGLCPPADDNNGSQNAQSVTMMRNIVQTLLMSRLEARIVGWRDRTIRVFGGQFGLGDMLNQSGESHWAEASQHIDEVVRAPYIPNDPNAGGQAANVVDKSPAGIVAFLKDATARQAVQLAALAAQSIGLGFSHGVYEVNVAIVSLGLTHEEIAALYNSPEYKALWKNDIIPMLAAQGGYIDLYSDCTNVYEGRFQQWGMEIIPGHPTINGAMEAVEEYEAAAIAAANDNAIVAQTDAG